MYLRVFSKADATRTAKASAAFSVQEMDAWTGRSPVGPYGGGGGRGKRRGANRNLSLSLSTSNPTWQWSAMEQQGLGEKSDVGRRLWWRFVLITAKVLDEETEGQKRNGQKK